MKMSQTLTKLNKLTSRLNHITNNESGKSTSSKKPGIKVRDSLFATKGGHLPTGTFTGLILAVFGLPFCLGLILCSYDTYATESTLALSIDNPVVQMNVSPSVTGAFAKSNPSTISASTNNATGYTLTIAAGDSSSTYDKLINSSDNTKTLNSIENALTESQFKALDGTAYNNMWGYLPSKYNSSANTDFLPSPGKGTVISPADTINQTHCANGVGACTESTDTYSLTLGARVDTTAKIGAYSNTYVVALVANATPYRIAFIDDTITNMPLDISGTSDTAYVTITDQAPTKNGYTFLGWCMTQPIHNANGNDTCSGTVYNPNGGGTNLNVPIDQTATTNNISLYAMWGGNYVIGSISTMQQLGTMNMDEKAKVVSSMVTETNYTVQDSRDNQQYTISKLKDGSVWMTRSLNISSNTTISAADSDVPVGYILPTTNGFQSGNKLPVSSITGFDDNTKAFVYNSGNTSISGDTNCGASGNSNPCYSYYSYIAATAGSGLNTTIDGEDAPYSICPKGWRLPISGAATVTDATNPASYKRGDFYKLATAYGVDLESAHNSNTSTFYDNLGPGTRANFLLAGFDSSSTFLNGGVAGYYWSATAAASTSNAHRLYFDAGNLLSASEYHRYRGLSVRCILR